jgi:hypothetical protein
MLASPLSKMGESFNTTHGFPLAFQGYGYSSDKKARTLVSKSLKLARTKPDIIAEKP